MSTPFRYFKATHADESFDYYRADPDKPPATRVRRSEDGMWVPTDYRSVTDLLLDVYRFDELSAGEVPCHLCMLVAGAVTRVVVREWPDAVAVSPRPAPVVDGHILVVPATHTRDASVAPSVAGLAAVRAAELAAELGIGEWNYIQSNGRAATQSEPHVHGHIVPRRAGDGLALPWSPAPTHLDGEQT